jgi:hypothetical protein
MEWDSSANKWKFEDNPPDTITLTTSGKTGNYFHNFLNDEHGKINRSPMPLAYFGI